MGKIERRLLELGIELPKPSTPAANYVPYVITGNTVVISGQVTFAGGKLQYAGKVGGDFSVDDGYQAARICALNLISQLREACDGDLDRVHRVVRLGGFVNCTPDFTEQPKVINGASDIMVEIFGDAGKHARAAVGCSSLPLGSATEVDGIFDII
ncbi:MAG: RidA family protein [Rhodospirillales bacterium]|jgi:enamine deaminase RidA (YjgF/YER057c/UK114 family)